MAAALLVATLAGRDLAAPRAMVACSCAPWPESLAAFRTDENVRILLGTVVALTGERGTFGIERVFKGPVPGPAMAIDGGDAAMCGLGLKLGARMIVAAWTEGNVLQPSSCMPAAILPSPEGDAMLADAEASSGGLAPPPAAPAEPTTQPADAPAAPGPVSAGLALPLAIGGAIVVAVLLFGGLILVARRRPQERES
jgi:hypothetical protein